MRPSWRLLHFRPRVGPRTRMPVHHSHLESQSLPDIGSLRSLTSLLHGKLCPSQPIFSPRFSDSINPRNHEIRRFSSESELETEDSDHLLVTEIFAEPKSSEEVRKGLEANNFVISHERIISILQRLESSPVVARNFFNWVSESEEKRLSSKSYNLMLRILGVNGNVSEFWDLFEVMKTKGYGISKGVRDGVLEKMKKEGTISDVKKLKRVFNLGSIDNSDEKISSKVSKIIRNDVWSDDVEKQLSDLSVTFSSDMVQSVLESLGSEPIKALLFFRWIEESGLFKHDEKTYNAVAKALGREDCSDSFWKVIDSMKSSEMELDATTFSVVLGRFCKRRMIEDAVNLYEFAMAGPKSKPSVDCSIFLLKKIAVAKNFSIDLFSRVLKTSVDNEIPLTDSMLEAVVKSLKSVNKIEVSLKVLKAMEESGYVASANTKSKLVFVLATAKKKKEAVKLMKTYEGSSKTRDWSTRKSLIQGLCLTGDLEKASDSLQYMVKREGVDSAYYPLDSIVIGYCNRKKANEAYKLLHNLVTENQVKPWHTTYQVLITGLLAQGGFSNALNLLGLMKSHDFPPFVDPFVEYVSKSGTGEEAAAFLNATSKRIASTTLFLRVFEAYFKSGRRSEAQNFLSQCPSFIRNYPDVLDLFAAKKSGEGAVITPLTT